MKDDAEPRAGPQHLAVLVLVIARARELDGTIVDRDPRGAARNREGVVNAVAAPVGDHDVGAVASDQPADDRCRQRIATPEPVAADYDTHVQIMAPRPTSTQGVPTTH